MMGTQYPISALQLLPECKYKLTVVDLLVGEEAFDWSGSTLVDPGYTSVYTWQAVVTDDAPSVTWEKGQVWGVEQVHMRTGRGRGRGRGRVGGERGVWEGKGEGGRGRG